MGMTKGNLSRQMTVGGFTFDWDPINNPNDILLMAAVDGANRYCSPRKTEAAAGYVVPALKTLRILGFKFTNHAAVACSPKIGSADTDQGYGTTTVPVNFVGNFLNGVGVTSPATIGNVSECATLIPIPAAKYVSLDSQDTSAAGVVLLYCKLGT